MQLESWPVSLSPWKLDEGVWGSERPERRHTVCCRSLRCRVAIPASLDTSKAGGELDPSPVLVVVGNSE